MISYINSKPMSPYISLLPLQNFLTKEQEYSRKGAITKPNTDKIGRESFNKRGKEKDKANGTYESTGQINWSKLLIDELTELMKKNEEEKDINLK